jgi:hypothetical protein
MISETEVSVDRKATRKAVYIARCVLGAIVAALSFANYSHAVTAYSVRSDVDRQLYQIDLSTGVATAIGASNFNKIEALAINETGDLFGVNPSTAELVRCSTASGGCTTVGTLSGVPPAQTNVGLAFSASGTLYVAMSAIVYSVNPTTAAATVLGSSGAAISGLASGRVTAACASGLYAIGGNSDQGRFYCINTTTGAATLLGNIAAPTALDGGLDGDLTTGLVWGITNGTTAQIYSIDPSVSPIAASNVRSVTVGGVATGGFESLAVVRSQATGPGPGPGPGLANEGPSIPTLGGLSGFLALLGAMAAVGARASRRH